MSLSFDNSEAGCMLFYDCHRSVPAPFLTKTYHLVNDPSTNEIVSWGEDDTTFVVWRPPEFARDLLPNYFKHNNFSSFVRQLNTYGFRKVVPDRWEFANDFFRRGEGHLLCEIHRRKALQPAPGTSGSAQQSRSLSPSTSVEDQAWASPISSPLPSPIPAHNLVVLPSSHHHSPSTVTTPTLSISDENERLRKHNNLLLLEVSRLRRLYEETINMIQNQFKGSSPEHCTTFSRIGPTLDRAPISTAMSGESAMFHWDDRLGPAPDAIRRDSENRELSAVHVSKLVPKTSNVESHFCKNYVPPSTDAIHHVTVTPPLPPPTSTQRQQQQHHHHHHQQVDHQLQISDSKRLPFFGDSSTSPSASASPPPLEIAGQIPVKLFGVPLQYVNLEPVSSSTPASKRRQGDQTWDVSDQIINPNDRAFLRPPPRKCLRTNSEMASDLRPSSTAQAPSWLQICATRDEGVYI